jgi:hypothetical protein
MGNRVTQIYLRTGQPGVAPERKVMDEYDISGYFTKVEATEDKLYSLVKAGVRQFLWNHFAQGTMMFLDDIIGASGSREKLTQVTQHMLDGFSLQADGAEPPSLSGRGCTWLGRRLVTLHGLDEQGAVALRGRLGKLGGQPSADGKASIVGDGRTTMITFPSPNPDDEICSIITTHFDAPPFLTSTVYRILAGLSHAWALAT